MKIRRNIVFTFFTKHVRYCFGNATTELLEMVSICRATTGGKMTLTVAVDRFQF